MAVTAAATGTSNGTVGTEVILHNTSAAASYVSRFRCNNMGTADVVELRWYAMTLTGGTQEVAYYTRIAGAQPTDDMVKMSVPVSTDLTDSGALRFTFKQTAGTSRAFDWTVMKFA